MTYTGLKLTRTTVGDQGDTTDEEDVPASATTRPSALLRDSSASAFNNRLARQPLPKAPTSRLPRGHQWGPRLGSWITDPTKPLAVVSGKSLIVYPAQRPASKAGKIFPTVASSGVSSAVASPRVSVPRLATPSRPVATDDSEVERTALSSREAPTPTTGPGPNLMLAGLGLGGGNMLSAHVLGPPEAFYPFHSIGADGTMISDGIDGEDDDDDDGEDDLNIDDFINYGESSDDDEQEAGSVNEGLQSPTGPLSDQFKEKDTSTPSASPTTPSHNFLDRFDKGLVTAFRRNQYNRGGTNSFPSSSPPPFQHTGNALKSNAFADPSFISSSLKKRKLGGAFAPPAPPNPTLTKRRIMNTH